MSAHNVCNGSIVMKKIIIVSVVICALTAIVLSIFFINNSKKDYPQNEFSQKNYPQNECSKKIGKYMVSEEISGFARLTEENKIEIYVDRNIELDTDIKVTTTTINKLISQVEDPYLCSIRIEKYNGSGGPHRDSIVIANYTPKDLQPYVAPPYQLLEPDIKEARSRSEDFYYVFANFLPSDVIDSSMPEIKHITISLFHTFYQNKIIDVSKDFEFLKYFPNLESIKIIHTKNGDRSFENSDENIEQLKKITPENCVIEIEE